MKQVIKKNELQEVKDLSKGVKHKASKLIIPTVNCHKNYSLRLRIRMKYKYVPSDSRLLYFGREGVIDYKN